MIRGRRLHQKALFMAVFVALALALLAGCASIKGETAGEYVDDSTITTKVNAIIVQDPDAHYFKIDVTTTQGDVVLQGFVNNRATEDRLAAKIRGIKGVKSVRSLLRIENRK